MNNGFGSCGPEEIGLLENLTVLDVSFNELMGPLPDSIGGMVSLEVLNVAHNMLRIVAPARKIERWTILDSICELPKVQNFIYSFASEPPSYLAFPSTDDRKRPAQRSEGQCKALLSEKVYCSASECHPIIPTLPPPSPPSPPEFQCLHHLLLWTPHSSHLLSFCHSQHRYILPQHLFTHRFRQYILLHHQFTHLLFCLHLHLGHRPLLQLFTHRHHRLLLLHLHLHCLLRDVYAHIYLLHQFLHPPPAPIIVHHHNLSNTAVHSGFDLFHQIRQRV